MPARRAIAGCLAAALLAACETAPIAAPSDASSPTRGLGMQLWYARTDTKQYEYFVVGEDGSLAFGGGMKAFDRETDVAKVGSVLSVGDGIARVDGLRNVMANELLETPDGVAGLALNLEEEAVGVAVLDDVARVREGDVFRRTGRVMSVPAGPALTGQEGRHAHCHLERQLDQCPTRRGSGLVQRGQSRRRLPARNQVC